MLCCIPGDRWPGTEASHKTAGFPRRKTLPGAILDVLNRLRELQEVDSLLDRLREKRAALDRELAAEEENLAQVRASLQGEETDAQALRRDVDRRELELKAKEEQIAKLQVQLNTVKTNREYAAIQHEIASLRADISLIEDESLRILEKIDEAQKRQVEGKRRLRELEAALASHRQEVQQRHRQIEEETTRLQARREEIAAALAPDHRELYERLRTKSDGRAVVAARYGSCEGCFMNLTHNTINHLMGGDSLVRCHSCGRILYLVREDEEDSEGARC